MTFSSSVLGPFLSSRLAAVLFVDKLTVGLRCERHSIVSAPVLLYIPPFGVLP